MKVTIVFLGWQNMERIKKGIILFLLLIGTAYCFGEQISFQIVQLNNSAENVTEEAKVVEDFLIDSFFDAGYIVTNSEAALAKSRAEYPKLWQTGMNEAIAGYSDYFVQVILQFTETLDETINKNVMILKNVDFSVYRTENLEELSKQNLPCNLKILNPSDMGTISDSLIFEINKVINA